MFYNAPLSMKDEMYHLYVCIFHMKYYTMYYYILRVTYFSTHFVLPVTETWNASFWPSGGLYLLK